MQQNTTGVFTVSCTQPANIDAYLRVKNDPTYGIALAGAAENEIGVLVNGFIAAGLGSSKKAALACPAFPGPIKHVAAGPIGQFAAVYAAANGKIDASGTLWKGFALDAATAAGDVIRVVRDWTQATNPAAAATGTTSKTFAVGSGNTGPTLAVSVDTSTGQYTETLQVPTLGAAATVTLPAVTSTLATLAGTESLTNKTISVAKVAVENTPVAATGADLAGAAAIGVQDTVTISSDSAAKGVKLLTGVAGQRRRLINTSATACLLYPAAGGTLSGLAAGTPVTIAAKHVVTCDCMAADTWWVSDAAALLA